MTSKAVNAAALAGMARRTHGVNPVKNPRQPSVRYIKRAASRIPAYVGTFVSGCACALAVWATDGDEKLIVGYDGLSMYGCTGQTSCFWLVRRDDCIPEACS